jgi:hypothetical protein
MPDTQQSTPTTIGVPHAVWGGISLPALWQDTRPFFYNATSGGHMLV